MGLSPAGADVLSPGSKPLVSETTCLIFVSRPLLSCHPRDFLLLSASVAPW